MLKDKLFFFGAQEWVNFFQVPTNTATVPTAAMRSGDFSELLDPEQRFFTGAGHHAIPQTGQPFPGNIIPAGPPESERHGDAERVSRCRRPGSGRARTTLIHISDNPQDQRKDNIRLDYRLNDKNQFTLPLLGIQLGWRSTRSAATFPFARTDWDRPNQTQTASWTSTLSNTLINESSFTYALDEVFIDVFTRDATSTSAASTGINYPVHLPGDKEIPDKIPTITHRRRSPRSTAGRIRRRRAVRFTPSTMRRRIVKGRHTFKAGISVEYSGQDDFDQINVQPIPGSTNNQNGRSSSRNAAPAARDSAIANAALGLFTNYAEIGQRGVHASGARSRPTCSFRIPGGRPTT